MQQVAILLKLPCVVERARCALVSKQWADVLKDPELWADLDFCGVSKEHLTDDLILRLARKAAGKLRSFDVCAPEGVNVTLQLGGQPLLVAMAAEGLTANLESIEAHDGIQLETPDAARQLRAACPALRHVGIAICGAAWPDSLAIIEALSVPSAATLVLCPALPPHRRRGPLPTQSFPDLARGVAAALARTSIERVAFLPGSGPADDGPEPVFFDDLVFDIYRLSEAQMFANFNAILALGEALADPERGPKELSIVPPEGAALPVFAQRVCRAVLNPQSPLRTLRLCGLGDGNDATATIAAALAPGRSRLESLSIPRAGDMSVARCVRTVVVVHIRRPLHVLLRLMIIPPCSALTHPPPPPAPRSFVALCDAIAANETLTHLNLRKCTVGRQEPPGAAEQQGDAAAAERAAAALFRALTRSKSLREATLEAVSFGRDGTRSLFPRSALPLPAAGGNAAAGALPVGSLTSLDISDFRVAPGDAQAAAAALLAALPALETLAVRKVRPAGGGGEGGGDGGGGGAGSSQDGDEEERVGGAELMAGVCEAVLGRSVCGGGASSSSPPPRQSSSLRTLVLEDCAFDDKSAIAAPPSLCSAAPAAGRKQRGKAAAPTSDISAVRSAVSVRCLSESAVLPRRRRTACGRPSGPGVSL